MNLHELTQQEKIDLTRELPQMEMLYILFSDLTHVPFISYNTETCEDEVFLFTSEDDAKAKCEELEKAGIQKCRLIKVENKSILKMFSDFYHYGITVVIFYTEKGIGRYFLKDIVKRKDMSALPDDKKPLENPSLQISLIYYMQELRKDLLHPQRPELKDMDEEAGANIGRARYLIPLKEEEVDGEKRMQHIMLKIKNEDFLMPIFSDAMEYQKFCRGQEDLKPVLADVEKLLSLNLPDNTKGFVINPAGVAVPVRLEYLKQLYQLMN